VSYWSCAQIQATRERLALHCLALAGYKTYAPHIREQRTRRTPPLFPGYVFVLIELQWHTARSCPGVCRLVLDGARPAKVSDKVIAELRGREHRGLIELPPPPGFQRGDRVRISRGLFTDQLALFDGMKGPERVTVLLSLLGRLELSKGDIVSA
jgi:transcription antitermination factor NusG